MGLHIITLLSWAMSEKCGKVNMGNGKKNMNWIYFRFVHLLKFKFFTYSLPIISSLFEMHSHEIFSLSIDIFPNSLDPRDVFIATWRTPYIRTGNHSPCTMYLLVDKCPHNIYCTTPIGHAKGHFLFNCCQFCVHTAHMLFGYRKKLHRGRSPSMHLYCFAETVTS